MIGDPALARGDEALSADLTLPLVPLPKPHPRASAVFIDEFDAHGLSHRSVGQGAATRLLCMHPSGSRLVRDGAGLFSVRYRINYC
jgi:hypothetical protein